MIYLKSFFAGIIGLILSVFVIPIGFGIFSVLFHKVSSVAPGEAAVGWDLRSLFGTSIVPWIAVLVIFGLGFYWEFRRASH